MTREQRHEGYMKAMELERLTANARVTFDADTGRFVCIMRGTEGDVRRVIDIVRDSEKKQKQYRHRVEVRAAICFDVDSFVEKPTHKELRELILDELSEHDAETFIGYDVSLPNGKAFVSWGHVEDERYVKLTDSFRLVDASVVTNK